MELHTQTRSTMNPDPEYDSIQGIFYNIHNVSEKSLSTTGKYIKIIIINYYFYNIIL